MPKARRTITKGSRRPRRTITSIADLRQDPKNARRHNPRNVGMIVDALHEVGAGRSIVIDESGIILAGNATIEAAAEAGIQKVRVIQTDGNEIIAVQRTGLTKRQKTRLALRDNRAAELAEWEPDILGNLEAADLDGLFTIEELSDILDRANSVEAPDLPSGDGGEFEHVTFTLHRTQAAAVRAAVDRAKVAGAGETAINANSNGNALTAICEAYRG